MSVETQDMILEGRRLEQRRRSTDKSLVAIGADRAKQMVKEDFGKVLIFGLVGLLFSCALFETFLAYNVRLIPPALDELMQHAKWGLGAAVTYQFILKKTRAEQEMVQIAKKIAEKETPDLRLPSYKEQD